MSAAIAVRTGADVSLTIRYAALSGPKLAHLLPRSWPETKRKGRPTLCGLWRVQWRPVERTDDPHAYNACPDCDTAAGLAQPEPVALVPEPRGRAHRTHPLDVVTVRGRLLDPQLAAAALPDRHRLHVKARFTADGRPCDRYGIPIGPEALDYRLAPYEQRVPDPS